MPRRKTHDEYRLEIQNKYPKLTLLTKYINAKTIVKFKCGDCNNTFTISPDMLSRNYRNTDYIPCPYCSGRVLNNEIFLKRIESNNNHIIILSEYSGIFKNVKCRCKICGYTWEEIAKNILVRNFCPKCKYKAKIKPISKVINELNKKNQNTTVEIKETEYEGTKSKIHCQCKTCGYTWDSTISSFRNSKGYCPKCINKLRRTNEEFLLELSKINTSIKPIDYFTTVNHKIRCKCLICGQVWKVMPRNLITGEKSGCPNCNRSKGEKRIEEFLTSNNLDYIVQKEFDDLVGLNGGKLSFDFFIPKFNLLIEYQGEFHDGTARLQSGNKLVKQKEHDNRKRSYAQRNNINLLEIWYWNFNNIDNILSKYLNNE